MENYSYSSYPDSRDSSPRSLDHQSWDDQQLPPNSNPNYKVKLMCSYGGKIHPRPHDHQLSYVGGDTKILSVDRSIKFSAFLSKLSSLCDISDLCFKYQLPGEDLDALISVTNDEDLDHMMLEYDRLCRASAKPARLRLFLFPLNPPSSDPSNFGSGEPKSERQWFVDALNSVQIQPLEDASPQAEAAASNPDFLFGLDKGFQNLPAGKLQDAPPQKVPEVVGVKDVTAGSDCGSEDRHLMGEPAEIQRQIQEFQRMQNATHEQACQAMFNKTSEDGVYFSQKAPEKISQAQAPVPVPMPVPIQAVYYSERHMPTPGYQVAATTPGTEQPMYLISSPGGVYQQAPPTMRTVTAQMGQAYYGMQRMAAPPQEVYREQPVYNAMPPLPAMHQQPKVGLYNEGIGMQQQQQQKVGVTEQGYAQIGYDSAGRQVYYTPAGGMPPQQYQVAAVDPRQGGGGGTPNQEGKVIKTPQSPV